MSRAKSPKFSKEAIMQAISQSSSHSNAQKTEQDDSDMDSSDDQDDQSESQSTNQSENQSTGQSISQPNDQLDVDSVDPSHNQLNNQSLKQRSKPPPISTITTTLDSAVPFLTRVSQSVQLQSIYQSINLKAEWAIFWLMFFIKIQLMFNYRSTDFEVHRNWMAITDKLPISQWYTDTTSIWTLDYPPFFAYFEKCLSLIARLIDPSMLALVPNFVVEQTLYPSVVIYQRLTVIFSDLVLFYACLSFARARAPWLPLDHRHSRSTLLFLSIACPGLLFVDHIHFQYNGFLLGIFILSLSFISRGDDLYGACMFAILLNFKHIFLYVAPAYFVYLLCHYCMVDRDSTFQGWEQFNQTVSQKKVFSWQRFIKLGVCVTLITLVSFGPFIYHGQLGQIKERLFPFKRGLSHAYWAPNFWALYNFADLVLTVLFKRLNLLSASATSSLTGGLVHDVTHTVLPSITPFMTFVLTLLAMMPVLIRLWRTPHPSVFMSSVIYCSLCSFMLGWHVHEKAILLVTLPLSLLACDRVSDTSLFIQLSTIANYSLFPLLYQSAETPIKVVLFSVYTVIAVVILHDYHCQQQRKRRIAFHGLLSLGQRLYLTGIGPLFFFTDFVCPVMFPRYEFAPLMLTSVYCAAGMMHSWSKCYQAVKIRQSLLDTYD